MPPPHGRRNVPRYQTKKSSSGCCCRCICCFCCFLFLLVLALGGIAFYIYVVYKPQAPLYSVEGLRVKEFRIQRSDFSLNTVFTVTVRADNPNTHIGFIYGKNSSVFVTYRDSVLCSGKLPNFEQPAHNTTMMQVDLTGVSEFGSGLQDAFKENKETGQIPLLVKVKVPVSIVLQSFPLRECVVYVNCSLVVDNLQPGKQIGLVKSEYTFDVAF